MKYEEILKILDKYGIATIDHLEYCLSIFDSNDECLDDPKYSDKNCMNAKCYEEYGVPDCRKIVEVYNKYFQKEISKKKLFIDYLDTHTEKSKSSIDNYLSCKSCNQQITKGARTSLKISDSEFKKDFCNNLSIKFDYSSLFETNYFSIKQFLTKEHMITSETFTPVYKEINTMTKDEEKKLFDVTHTSKEKLKENLNNDNNLQGTDEYKLNLAMYAFERNLLLETQKIIKLLESSHCTNEKYLQLKAKLLSSQNKDKEAIIILKKLNKVIFPTIDTETQNLLAASIKRNAFNEYELYGDESLLIQKLKESRDIYASVYKLNHDYYPALNYLYLNFMLAYINNEDKKHLKSLKNEAEAIWKSTNIKINDWWSFVSNIEFLILIEKYDEAKIQLSEHFNELEQDEITEFNISSTLRQLKLYQNFCNNSNLKDIIAYIGKLNP